MTSEKKGLSTIMVGTVLSMFITLSYERKKTSLANNMVAWVDEIFHKTTLTTREKHVQMLCTLIGTVDTLDNDASTMIVNAWPHLALSEYDAWQQPPVYISLPQNDKYARLSPGMPVSTILPGGLPP